MNKTILFLILSLLLINSAVALTQVEVVYKTSTDYFERLTVNAIANPIFSLDGGESRKFINITYPYNLLSEIEAELNAEGIYLEPNGTETAKFHREAYEDSIATDTWYNITWDLEVPNETTKGFELTENNDSITVNFDRGIVEIDGCVRPYNDNAGTLETSIYTRILVNNNEARCLQASSSKGFLGKSIDIIHYSGTVYVTDDDRIYLQYRVENTDIDINGSNVFDNPVGASITLQKISD